MSSRVNGLLTDLYELTMAAGYYAAGKVQQKATFELTIRRLPAHRNFVIAAGLAQAIDYLLNLSFERRGNRLPADLPAFANASAGLLRLSARTSVSRAMSSPYPKGLRCSPASR